MIMASDVPLLANEEEMNLLRRRFSISHAKQALPTSLPPSPNTWFSFLVLRLLN